MRNCQVNSIKDGARVPYFVFMEDIIGRLQRLNRIGTAKNYSVALGSFRRFRKDVDISIGSIDYLLMEDYQAYLTSFGIVPNSTSFYMRILRAVYNRAVNQNLTEGRKPIRSVFTGVENTLKRAISLEDVRRIRNLNLSPAHGLAFARDIFRFLFFCRGMSFIDVAFLKKTDIRTGVLSYRRHKTGQMLHIKVIRQMQEIIDRHSDAESPYLLPVIGDSEGNTRLNYEVALRRVSNALKTIGRMVNLHIPLTTYVSRHAWASIAKSKNIPVNVISDALGHNSISTTQIYLASIDTSVIDRVNDLTVGDL